MPASAIFDEDGRLTSVTAGGVTTSFAYSEGDAGSGLALGHLLCPARAMKCGLTAADELAFQVERSYKAPLT